MKSIRDIYKIGAGPSSSHTMGPERACKQMLSEYDNIKSVIANLYGSLSLTGKGHLTDYIIEKTFGDIPTTVNFLLENKQHENTMELIATLETGEEIKWTILSIGGGDIEILGHESKDVADVYPHNCMTEITYFCEQEKISFFEYIKKFDADVIDYIDEVWATMEKSIENGLKTEGVLPGPLKIQRRAKILNAPVGHDHELKLSAYAHAVNEENASGGTIVTAPTCGACGVIPATLKYYEEEYGFTREKLVEALAVAGLFGQVVKTNATVSGAVAGCQAEVGTATAMAAAAIVYLKGGTNAQIEAGAEIGLEHQLGLTCDPILGFVQMPCIQRNAIGAVKARLASKLALVDHDLKIIDFDTIVTVMYETGKDMASAYRETSTGGIAKFYKMRSELEK